VDLKLRNVEGLSLMNFAIECDNINAAELLLQYDYDLEMEDKHGDAPFEYALRVTHGLEKFIRLFVDYGVDLNVKSRWVELFHPAIVHFNQPTIQHIVTNCKFDNNSTLNATTYRDNVLMCLVRKCWYDGCAVILTMNDNVDFDYQNASGETLLNLLVQHYISSKNEKVLHLIKIVFDNLSTFDDNALLSRDHTNNSALDWIKLSACRNNNLIDIYNDHSSKFSNYSY
jgi:hypothetical protein